jgi:hypothetical protein
LAGPPSTRKTVRPRDSNGIESGSAKREVLVLIQDHPIGALKEVGPVGFRQESVMNSNVLQESLVRSLTLRMEITYRSIALTEAGDVPDHIVSLEVEARDLVHSDHTD